MKNWAYAAALLCAASFANMNTAQATEGGGNSYPPGASIYLAGAMPPPGEYILFQPNYYTAGQLNDSSGNKIPLDFSVQSVSQTFRGFLVTPYQFLGAQVAAQVILPVVDLHAEVAGQKTNKLGFGDIGFSPVLLGWHFGPNLTLVFGTDIFTPVGQYNVNSLANIGRNVWSFQPTFGLAYIDPQGWQAQISPRFAFNTTNDATHYHSGADFDLDFAVARNIGGWRLGVSGYYYVQYQDDTQNGLTVDGDGHRGQAFAVGPAISHDIGPLQATFTWQHEFMADNRAQGENLWMQLGLRL
ncbi:transporter [Nitrospirillum sp. BR 11752]|uniref:SphA family protein n=1 Tax=Nitrospirillum sp. BR 11752 TaxID=3104293 RepID=UPI002EADCA07|nr:transporter [Nitrospirillum sp. BR 11752]